VVFWYRNGNPVANDPAVAVTTREQTSPPVGAKSSKTLAVGASTEWIVSQLTVSPASAARHSGVYECGAPEHLRPAKVNLHVIRGQSRVVRKTLFDRFQIRAASS